MTCMRLFYCCVFCFVLHAMNQFKKSLSFKTIYCRKKQIGALMALWPLHCVKGCFTTHMHSHLRHICIRDASYLSPGFPEIAWELLQLLPRPYIQGFGCTQVYCLSVPSVFPPFSATHCRMLTRANAGAVVRTQDRCRGVGCRVRGG
jgi:hypothetical protein